MAPRKKAKKNEKTVKDFALMLGTISNLYESKGDVGRSKSFATAAANITAFADLTNRSEAPLRSTEDFKDVKGVGKSTLDMLDEFIETGTCARLEELDLSFDRIREILYSGDNKELHLIREERLIALLEAEAKFIDKAKVNIATAFKAFPYKEKPTYDFDGQSGFKLVSNIVSQHDWFGRPLFVYHVEWYKLLRTSHVAPRSREDSTIITGVSYSEASFNRKKWNPSYTHFDAVVKIFHRHEWFSFSCKSHMGTEFEKKPEKYMTGFPNPLLDYREKPFDKNAARDALTILLLAETQNKYALTLNPDRWEYSN